MLKSIEAVVLYARNLQLQAKLRRKDQELEAMYKRLAELDAAEKDAIARVQEFELDGEGGE